MRRVEDEKSFSQLTRVDPKTVGRIYYLDFIQNKIAGFKRRRSTGPEEPRTCHHGLGLGLGVQRSDCGWVVKERSLDRLHWNTNLSIWISQ